MLEDPLDWPRHFVLIITAFLSGPAWYGIALTLVSTWVVSRRSRALPMFLIGVATFIAFYVVVFVGILCIIESPLSGHWPILVWYGTCVALATAVVVSSAVFLFKRGRQPRVPVGRDQRSRDQR